MEKPTIWVIDDDVALRLILDDTLTEAGFDVKTFGQAKLAWQTLVSLDDDDTSHALPQVIITDIRMPMMDGLTFSDKLHAQFPHIPVIIMTAHADVQSAVDSYQTGAFDYLPKPFELDDAVNMVQKAVRQYRNNSQTVVKKTKNNERLAKNTDDYTAYLPNNTDENLDRTQQNPSGIIGQSVAMQQVFRAIGRLSNTPITVLITGESGTGKELIAAALHAHSPRKNKPFIALNMAAIPHELIEAELFGHEKGAFTGAMATRVGRFEQAHGGTLFLDEIGDMPLPTQTRLLRVLANGEFYRVGGQKPIKVDVRIIAATHQQLETLVAQGKFREDLFYRLNVIRLALPALRERREDIPLLVAHFMQSIAHQLSLPPKTIAPQAMQRLIDYDWRGNVRQLENICRWLMVMTTGQVVQADDLPAEITALAQVLMPDRPDSLSDNLAQPAELPTQSAQISFADDTEREPTLATNSIALPDSIPQATDPHFQSTKPALDWLTPLANWANHALATGERDILQQATPLFEQCLLKVALAHTQQHKSEAALLLGWGRNTLTRKYQQLIAEDDRDNTPLL